VDISALLLSRIQFAFTVSFHIIFPAFTIGLAAWLAFLEACSLIFKKPVYRRLFDFWRSGERRPRWASASHHQKQEWTHEILCRSTYAISGSLETRRL